MLPRRFVGPVILSDYGISLHTGWIVFVRFLYADFEHPSRPALAPVRQTGNASFNCPGLFIQMAQFSVIIQHFLNGLQASLKTVYLDIDLLETVETQCLAHGIIIY